MTTVTVFRHEPPPLIGVCGVVPDQISEAFEQALDWLEATGVLVERIDPIRQPAAAARFREVVGALATDGERCLPLILVDGVIASSRIRPTRAQLARIVGQNRSHTELAAAR